MRSRFGTQGCRFAAACLLAAAAGSALPVKVAAADDHPVMLQWFETRWSTIEYRMPDFFMAGYDSVWIPPAFKSADPTSAGFDAFDRFDLGSPGAETAYGTQESMRAMIEEFHQASALVYVDLVMNHNSGRNNSDDFFNAGGYPGFALRYNGFWGDFNDGSKQSHDPGSPGNYNLWDGDLVGLIDIRQETNNQLIRQPVSAVPPMGQTNIPAGSVRNKPNANNARFYPDRDLTPANFVNPGRPAAGQTDVPARSSVAPANITIYPFNLSNPLAGDPVPENATGYLTRSTQWLLEVINIDGFRLDAQKHVPHWFWDQYWDNVVFQRRKTFSGGYVTPFSFGECVASNTGTLTYIRKDGFGFRDALDLNGAGQLRDILNNNGFGSWQNVMNAHLDTADDGLNNGSVGVTHIFSHDNGSTGDGGSKPPLPGPERYGLPQNAYLLFRGGLPIVYHNSREFIDRFQFRGFWPREGNPTALGWSNNDLTNLVRLGNGYARGIFVPLNATNPDNGNSNSNADVLVFERKRDGGVSNVVVAVNDSYLSGYTRRDVQTSFPAGTRLHELTGNHADPTVDPNNDIPELITVGSGGNIQIRVPFNKNVSGVSHHKGYVAYGPAAPSGTFDVTQTSGSAFTTQFAADGAGVPSYRRRLTAIPIITTSQFDIRLTTSKTDPSDPDWDDFAAFRIDGGDPSAGAAPDFNGQNGGPDFSDSDPYLPRYESYATQSAPLATTPGATNGLYKQTINTSSLGEGYHYIKSIAFRRRPSGTDPIYTEFRKVIYVDRVPPVVTMPETTFANPIPTLRVLASDRTTSEVYIMANLPGGTDPLTQLNTANKASQYDRFEWRKAFSGLNRSPQTNTITVVAVEPTGNKSITNYTVTITVGSGDMNNDGFVDLEDLYYGYANLAALSGPTGVDNANADINANGAVNILDMQAFETQLRTTTELLNMSKPER